MPLKAINLSYSIIRESLNLCTFPNRLYESFNCHIHTVCVNYIGMCSFRVTEKCKYVANYCIARKLWALHFWGFQGFGVTLKTLYLNFLPIVRIEEWYTATWLVCYHKLPNTQSSISMQKFLFKVKSVNPQIFTPWNFPAIWCTVCIATAL